MKAFWSSSKKQILGLLSQCCVTSAVFITDTEIRVHIGDVRVMHIADGDVLDFYRGLREAINRLNEKYAEKVGQLADLLRAGHVPRREKGWEFSYSKWDEGMVPSPVYLTKLGDIVVSQLELTAAQTAVFDSQVWESKKNAKASDLEALAYRTTRCGVGGKYETTSRKKHLKAEEYHLEARGVRDSTQKTTVYYR